jgi:hypothetical protein
MQCGTSSGVMITFEKIEVVNRLKKSLAYETIKNYTVSYDQTWIFSKIQYMVINAAMKLISSARVTPSKRCLSTISTSLTRVSRRHCRLVVASGRLVSKSSLSESPNLKFPHPSPRTMRAVRLKRPSC